MDMTWHETIAGSVKFRYEAHMWLLYFVVTDIGKGNLLLKLASLVN